jgi:hypothetical protein
LLVGGVPSVWHTLGDGLEFGKGVSIPRHDHSQHNTIAAAAATTGRRFSGRGGIWHSVCVFVCLFCLLVRASELEARALLVANWMDRVGQGRAG